MHISRAAHFVAILAGAVMAPTCLTAEDIEAARPHWEDVTAMADYRSDLYAAFLNCSDAAAARILSQGEVTACNRLYLALKLSYLNGVTLDRYDAMPAKTKGIAQEKGYAAFRAWRHRQMTMPGDLVAEQKTP